MKVGKFIKLDRKRNKLFVYNNELYVGTSDFFKIDPKTGKLYAAVWGQWRGRPDAYFFVPVEPT